MIFLSYPDPIGSAPKVSWLVQPSDPDHQDPHLLHRDHFDHDHHFLPDGLGHTQEPWKMENESRGHGKEMGKRRF